MSEPAAPRWGRWARQVRRLLPFLGLPLLVWLLVRIGVGPLAREVAQADLGVLASSLLLTPVAMALLAWRWQRLLALFGVRLRFGVVLFHCLLGQFYGVVTPGKIGSFIRITLIAKDTDAPLLPRVLSVLLDRIGDVVGLVGLGAGGCVVLALRLGRPGLAVAAATGIVVGILALAGLALWRPEHLLMRAGMLIPASVRARVGWRSGALALPPLGALVLPAALSLAAWGVLYFQTWVVAEALAVDIPWFDFILVMPLAGMVGLIPITVSGFGTRDAAVVGLAAIYGVAAEKALGMSLLAYSVSALFPSLLGALLAGIRAFAPRKTCT